LSLDAFAFALWATADQSAGKKKPAAVAGAGRNSTYPISPITADADRAQECFPVARHAAGHATDWQRLAVLTRGVAALPSGRATLERPTRETE
jgi:hypothetical protein